MSRYSMHQERLLAGLSFYYCSPTGFTYRGITDDFGFVVSVDFAQYYYFVRNKKRGS